MVGPAVPAPSAASTRPRPRRSASGFAPRDGEALLKHLRGRGFSRRGAGRRRSRRARAPRSPYDRFRGRLLWPIREASGDTIGFGARRIFDDDRIEAKYLNTPETADLQEEPGALRHRPGPPRDGPAVAGRRGRGLHRRDGLPPRRRRRPRSPSCGTAFGDDHAQVLRRFLARPRGVPRRGDLHLRRRRGRAEGGAARRFDGDQNFVSQTYVAVEPDGLDPCDLRIKKGDAAVRELVARRVPLYRFVLANIAHQVRPRPRRRPGRRPARGGRGWWPSIRDKSKVDAFARELATMIGVDVDEARARGAPGGQPRPAARRPGRAPVRSRRASAPAGARSGPPVLPTCATRASPRARDAQAGAPAPAGDRPHDRRRRRGRLHPPDVPRRSGRLVDRGRRAGGRRRRPRLGRRGCANAATDPAVVRGGHRARGRAAADGTTDPNPTYVLAHVFRLQELTTLRRIADLKSKLQRTNPVEHAAEYNRMFGELVALEQHRRKLRDRIVGTEAA